MSYVRLVPHKMCFSKGALLHYFYIIFFDKYICLSRNRNHNDMFGDIENHQNRKNEPELDESG